MYLTRACSQPSPSLFFFHAPATTEIYTLSLHDALPICGHRFVRYADDCNVYVRSARAGHRVMASLTLFLTTRLKLKDRKSTRLNSSHLGISYAVFCLKKKKIQN